MKRTFIQFAFGALIAVAGILLLLDVGGLLAAPSLAWTVLLAVASAMFWLLFASDRDAWWAAVPGAALLAAAVSTVAELDRGGWSEWAATLFLAIVSLGFWAVYIRDTRRWWPLLPAGGLTTLSVVTGIAGIARAPESAAVFLFGIATTFALVAVLPSAGSSRRWAWIPASALAVAAIIVLVSAGAWVTILNYIWPSAIVLAGVYIMWRTVQRSGGRQKRLDTRKARRGDIASPRPS